MGALRARSNNNLLPGYLTPATLLRPGYRGAVVLLHLNSGRFVEGTTVLYIATPVGRGGCVWCRERLGLASSLDIDTRGERPVHLNQKRRTTAPWLENRGGPICLDRLS
jgi:hypothetical protein